MDAFQSKAESFTDEQRWRQGHQLTRSQQERVADERMGLVAEGKALTGGLEAMNAPQAVSPQPQAAPITGPSYRPKPANPWQDVRDQPKPSPYDLSV